MEISILGSTLMENHTERENTPGPQDKYSSATSIKARNRAEANGGAARTYRLATRTRASTSTTRSMAKEFSLGQVAIFTKEITMRMRGKEMARCYGLMAACTKANGARAYSMGWAE